MKLNHKTALMTLQDNPKSIIVACAVKCSLHLAPLIVICWYIPVNDLFHVIYVVRHLQQMVICIDIQGPTGTENSEGVP